MLLNVETLGNLKGVVFLLTLLTGISIHGNGQSKAAHKEILGFACYEAGTSTAAVQKVEALIDEGKYDKIMKLLDSANTAERFLAVVACEKLAERGVLTLTEYQKKRIIENYNSERKVYVCAGCVYQDELELQTILHKENDFRRSAEHWFDFNFSEELSE